MSFMLVTALVFQELVDWSNDVPRNIPLMSVTALVSQESRGWLKRSSE